MVKYTYDAWGKPLSTTGSLASTLGTVQPFRYRGYVYDVETGLYYLRSRYYNPEWCRFVSTDTLLNCNLFSYAFQNPIFYCDSNGYEPIENIDGGNVVFHESITPLMQEYLLPQNRYYYEDGKHTSLKDATGETPGKIDCAYLLYETDPNPYQNFTGATLRYNDGCDNGSRGKIGKLIKQIDSGLPLETFVGYEVFHSDGNLNERGELIMTHVGRIVIHDFGNGPDLAVFQSCSVELSEKGSMNALYYGDTGPNITSLFIYNEKGEKTTGNWNYYGVRRVKTK